MLTRPFFVLLYRQSARVTKSLLQRHVIEAPTGKDKGKDAVKLKRKADKAKFKETVRNSKKTKNFLVDAKKAQEKNDHTKRNLAVLTYKSKAQLKKEALLAKVRDRMPTESGFLTLINFGGQLMNGNKTPPREEAPGDESCDEDYDDFDY